MCSSDDSLLGSITANMMGSKYHIWDQVVFFFPQEDEMSNFSSSYLVAHLLVAQPKLSDKEYHSFDNPHQATHYDFREALLIL